MSDFLMAEAQCDVLIHHSTVLAKMLSETLLHGDADRATHERGEVLADAIVSALEQLRVKQDAFGEVARL
ncbi:MAG: hypothetical protein AAGA74_20505 [Pseudomonadota bacterium]